jgi:prevent-host-death family protein
MMVSSITEAKAQLSALLERVAKGETIIIGKSGKPIAKLVPYTEERGERVPGALRGKIRISADFDSLPDDVAIPLGIKDPAR